MSRNQQRFGREGRQFRKLNLLTDVLPKVDLVFCRDCLVHFSDEHVLAALENICSSHSTYLMTTTFTNHDNINKIVTGQWRALNLERAPFNLPAPMFVIVEQCTQNGGRYADKAMALWRVEDIRHALA